MLQFLFRFLLIVFGVLLLRSVLRMLWRSPKPPSDRTVHGPSHGDRGIGADERPGIPYSEKDIVDVPFTEVEEESKTREP